MAKAIVLVASKRGAPRTVEQMIEHGIVLLKDAGKRDGFELVDSEHHHRHEIGVRLYNHCAIETSDIPRASLTIRDL